jgi:hypothetical protein
MSPNKLLAELSDRVLHCETISFGRSGKFWQRRLSAADRKLISDALRAHSSSLSLGACFTPG